MEKILAIDVGGTNIKYAVWTDRLGEVREVATPYESLEHFLNTISAILEEVGEVEGIALSFPGFIDNELGMKYGGGSLTYIDNTNIVELFEEKFHLPTAIENDAKAAALAEIKYGGLKNKRSGVVIILGTGVGGAVVIDNKVLKGANLLAGEFSFISGNINNYSDFNEYMAALCGKKGLSECVEKTSHLKDLNGREIFSLINEDDNKEVYEGLFDFCKRVGWLLYNLNVIINPEIFLIGGGISAQPLLKETLEKAIDAIWSELVISVAKPEIGICQFRNEANLIGAVINFENLKK